MRKLSEKAAEEQKEEMQQMDDVALSIFAAWAAQAARHLPDGLLDAGRLEKSSARYQEYGRALEVLQARGGVEWADRVVGAASELIAIAAQRVLDMRFRIIDEDAVEAGRRDDADADRWYERVFSAPISDAVCPSCGEPMIYRGGVDYYCPACGGGWELISQVERQS